MRAIFIASAAHGKDVRAGVQRNQKNRKIFQKEPVACARFFYDDFRMSGERIFTHCFCGNKSCRQNNLP